jgi:Domain of unknown function (DUF4214)
MLTERLPCWIRRLTKPVAARQTTLQLERLEERCNPSVSPNSLFVSTLYQGLLGRPADNAGLTYWTAELNAGVSRTQVAQGIAGSDEAMGRDVQLFYDTLLDRTADADGLAYWTQQLETGETLNQVKGGILGSDEFFNEVGGTNESFLNAVYEHELGRPVDANGLNYWEHQLDAGASRTTVADDVLASPEADNVKVASFYTDVLDRLPDAAGLNYWSAQLQAGVPETKVLAGILGSNEFYGRVEQAAAATTQTDPNQAAADFIGADALFTGPLPNAEYLAHQIPDKAPIPSPTPAPALGGDDSNPTDTSYNNGNTGDTTGTDNGNTGDTTGTDNSNTGDTTTTDSTDDNNTTDDTYVDPNADNNTYVDPNAADYNTYVDSTDTTDNTYVDPNAGDDNTYVDPNAGDDNTYVDPNANAAPVDTGTDTSVDTSSDTGFDTSDFSD